MHFRFWAALSGALMVAACQKEQTPAEQPAPPTAASSVAPAASGATLPLAKDGAYELADVIRWAMPSALPNPSHMADVQDYNRFKGVVSDIKRSASLRGGYEGKVVLAVNGVRSVFENIEDDYAWRVAIWGPNVGATAVTFDSFRAINGDASTAGPSYLRANGLDVVALNCFSVGGSPGNAEALYLVRAQGKSPTLMKLANSTGSAGVSLSYTLFFGPMAWADVPGTERDYLGKVQPFATCPYPDLR